jgi:hypothetical protein
MHIEIKKLFITIWFNINFKEKHQHIEKQQTNEEFTS